MPAPSARRWLAAPRERPAGSTSRTPWTDAAGLTARLDGLGDPSAWGDVDARG